MAGRGTAAPLFLNTKRKVEAMRCWITRDRIACGENFPALFFDDPPENEATIDGNVLWCVPEDSGGDCVLIEESDVESLGLTIAAGECREIKLSATFVGAK